MSVDPSHEAPHASSDPAYCETWAYLLTDVERKTTLLVHASWLPARGVGNHFVTLQRTGHVPQSLRVETREPLRSELFELEVDPWKNAHVRCPRLALDLEFPAFTPPVDFGSLFSLGHGMQQAHVQAGVRASGRIGDETLRNVPGFRDRSWGPRDLRQMGRLVALLMTGVDRDLFITVNSITQRGRDRYRIEYQPRRRGRPRDGDPGGRRGARCELSASQRSALAGRWEGGDRRGPRGLKEYLP